MQTILHFAQDSDTSGFFPQLAKWHDRRRFRMIFATLNPMAPWLRERMNSHGVECFSCDCKSRVQYLAGLVRLTRYLKQERVEILHTHLFEPSVIGLMAGTIARTPVRIMTRHYSDYHTRINKRVHVSVDRLCTRMSHAVIAVSQHTAGHMINAERAPQDRIRVILNGIDFDRVEVSGAEARERIRREFLPNGGDLLLIVARLHPEKGHHYLFEALPELRKRLNQRMKLIVAGTGPFEGVYKKEVEKLGCDDLVSFVGFRNDIPDLMSASDLVVLPSLAEAFGLVLAESLYLGTPVVASRVGGIPEIIEDGVDGLLVAPGDSKALTDTIVELLNDKPRLRTLAGKGRSRIAGGFRFEQMVRAYEEVYSELSRESVEGVHATSLGDRSHI